jgi:hypothetical protein
MFNRIRLNKKATIVAVVVTFFLAISLPTLKTANNLRNYIVALNGDVDSKIARESATRFSGDLDRVLGVSSLPLVSDLLNATGLNFSQIRNEIVTGIDIGPSILGSQKPLRYLIAVQNSAEARGTGGILGAYALLEFHKGSIKVVKTGSNEPLYGTSLKKIPVDVPEEFLKLYGNNPAIIQNSNLSPHFPYGAEIWLGLWKQEFGESLDGVIAVDPTALSYVLRSTGPVALASGEVITSENVVAETLEEAYKRYANDNKARKQHLVEIMNAVVTKLNTGDYSKLKMAKAIRDGIVANRILIYSTDEVVQSKLSKVRLGGFMSTESNNEFRAVVQNIDAGKLDYYLDRSIEIESKSCKKEKETQIKVIVTNTLKSANGLSDYVLTRADKGKPSNLVRGSHRFKVFIYGPVGARLVSVSRENRTANLGGSSTERERPIYITDVELKPGESEELLANFSGGTGKISFIDQPLVRTTKISITDKC